MKLKRERDMRKEDRDSRGRAKPASMERCVNSENMSVDVILMSTLHKTEGRRSKKQKLLLSSLLPVLTQTKTYMRMVLSPSFSFFA